MVFEVPRPGDKHGRGWQLPRLGNPLSVSYLKMNLFVYRGRHFHVNFPCDAHLARIAEILPNLYSDRRGASIRCLVHDRRATETDAKEGDYLVRQILLRRPRVLESRWLPLLHHLRILVAHFLPAHLHSAEAP